MSIIYYQFKILEIMKKLFVMAAMVLSSVGAFAQQAAGTTTIQPKVGLNVSTIGDNDWKAGFAAGAELQYQATSNFGVAVGALYSVQGFKGKDIENRYSNRRRNYPE